MARRRPAGSAVLTSAPRNHRTPDEESHTRGELRLATPRETALLLGRAVTLRCPYCGGRPVLANWLKLRIRCLHCGLRFERGEHDYFMGSMLFNLILSELLFVGMFIVYAIVVWPDVRWELAQYVLVVLVAAAPFVMFPFSKLLWLAFDLMLRPVTPEELEWHRSSEARFSTGR